MSLSTILASQVQLPLEGGFHHEPTALTDGSTVTPDFSVNNIFTWTITQNATLAFPSTVPGAGVWHIYLTQDTVGNHNVALASGYHLIDGTIEPGAEAETLITIISDGSGTDLDVWYYELSSVATLPYNIPYSVLLNDDDSACLVRTPGTAGNRTTWTWSGWIKRSNLNTGWLFFSHNGSGFGDGFRFGDATNHESIEINFSASTNGDNGIMETSAVFRDPAAWYHVQVACDTTQAVSDDRIKIYVNGERITSFSVNTPPSQNYSTTVNHTQAHSIGRRGDGTQYFDGYLSEVHYVDGLALSPSQFGKYNNKNQWIAKIITPSNWPANSRFISAGSGTTIGDMTAAGGNAAAFDGAVNASAASASKGSSPSSAYVGKNYGSGIIVNKFIVKSPSDSSFGGSSPIRIRLQASSTGAWGGEEVTLHDNAGIVNSGSAVVYTADNVENTTAYQYYRVLLSGASATTYYIAEVEFYELAPYGQNGFYLDFADNSDFGTDQSGNGNDYTDTNLGTTDQVTDTPTSNYCVANLFGEGNNRTNVCSYSNGNLTVTQPGTNGCLVYGTIGVSTGKWTWEVTVDNKAAGASDAFEIGIASVMDNSGVNATPDAWGTSYAYGYAYEHNSGNKIVLGTESAYGSSFTTGDVIRIELNIDGDAITFYKNGVSQGSLAIEAGRTWFPAWYAETSVDKVTFNFGQKSFVGTPTVGYNGLSLALNAEPTITLPSNYFDSVKYTGNGTANTRIWKQSFRPDLVWIKNRDSGSTDHKIFDSIRGATVHLSSNDQNAEAEEANSVTGFNFQGFTLGTSVSTDVNLDGTDYIAWSWKKSVAAGFDIQAYTGTGSAGLTFSHNLGVVPELIIIKNRGAGTTSWAAYHHRANGGTNPEQYFGLLNSSAAWTNSGGTAYWNDTAPSSSVVTVGNSSNTNASTNTYIAYLWSSIEGYSKIGSYVGNANADGPYIYTGFRPKFILFKRMSGGTGDWLIYDTQRDLINPVDNALFPNGQVAETSGSGDVDILSNGFKIRNTSANMNASSAIVGYLAIAEDPFKNSRAR
jgi:hypothetical protein